MHILATFATLCYQTQWPPNHSCTTRGQNVPFWAIFGHPPPFWPFWAILGHFGHFWPFLALFGPPGPPGAHFRTRIPPPIPENIPAHIVDKKKNPAAHPRRKKSPPHSRTNVRRTFSRRTLRANSPRTNLHKIPPHISAPKIRTQIPRKFSRAHLCTNSPDANSAQTSPEKKFDTTFCADKNIYVVKKILTICKTFCKFKKIIIVY